jgi:hypothetical protein
MMLVGARSIPMTAENVQLRSEEILVDATSTGI